MAGMPRETKTTIEAMMTISILWTSIRICPPNRTAALSHPRLLALAGLMMLAFGGVACSAAEEPSDSSIAEVVPTTPGVGTTPTTVTPAPVENPGVTPTPVNPVDTPSDPGETPVTPPVEPSPDEPGVPPATPAPVEPGAPASTGPDRPMLPPPPGSEQPPLIGLTEPVPNPYASQWAELNSQTSNGGDLNQCVGFLTPGTYRTFTPLSPNANPEDGDPCPGEGNTDASDGSCNVPCGFVRNGAAIGNKFCPCNGGTFGSCSCDLLPDVGLNLPVTSCDQEWQGYDPTNPEIFAKQMDGTPCLSEWSACITPDLPSAACEWTTAKGCMCLLNFDGQLLWQCNATNEWFWCEGTNCPQAHQDAGVINAKLKPWCQLQQ